MSFKSKVISIAAATFFALSIGTGALAQNTVQQEIGENSGALTASIGQATLGTKQFSNAVQTSEGTLTLDVEDGRGSNAGWNVTLSSGDFESTTQGLNESIPAENFTFVEAGALLAVIGDTQNMHPYMQSTSMDTTFRILYAQDKFGTGEFELPFDVALEIPAQQEVGVYVAELTVNISSGPGNN